MSVPEVLTKASGQRDDGWLGRWRAQGATVGAVIPAVYVWAVTVAPVAWGHGASAFASSAAVLGLVSIAAGPVLEKRGAEVARLVMGWGLVLSSIGAWVLAPEPAVAAFDAMRGIAGMIGWGLFAFAIASPPASSAVMAVRLDEAPVRARGGRIDTAILVVGLILAVALELPGWRIGQRDRALLLRLVALAGGLGILTVAGEIAARRLPPHDASRKKRRPPATAVAWVVVAIALLGAGIAFVHDAP